MRRRAFLTGLLAAIPAAGAHTPYGQWVTYRRKHLLIGCHRQDMETYALAQQVAEAFGHSLAEASTRVARAPHPQRLASLLGTDQLDLAILSVEDAIGIATGSGDFEPYGQVPLGMIAGFDTGHVFVAQSGFRADHAWLVTYAVGESSAIDPDMQPIAPLDWHEGARIFRNAGDMPDPPAAEQAVERRRALSARPAPPAPPC